jgi:hypothetical protein
MTGVLLGRLTLEGAIVREEQGAQPQAKAYIVETDAPCLACGEIHKYATKGCQLAIWLHSASATRVARRIEGIVRPLRHLPDDVSYVLYTTRPDGSRDPNLPEGRNIVMPL